MATYVYKIDTVYTFDGTPIEIIPLKIKYMRQVMDIFDTVEIGMSDDETIDILCECVRVCMKQYYPEISNSIEEVQDTFDLDTVYRILDLAVGIKINAQKEEDINKQSSTSQEQSSWDSLDLAKLETEIFLLGIWKSYEELELSLSMEELIETLGGKRELDHQEKKFLAALQGVQLDGEEEVDGQKAWEDMKARVFSGGATSDSNDILSYQGYNAEKAGFGIGMGLEYENLVN